MLLGDSIEFDYVESYRSAEAVPMILDIQLRDIWIPASLLPNRKTAIDFNLDKPGVFHVLERPDIRKLFSVYSNCPEDEDQDVSCTMATGNLIQNFTNKDMQDIHKELKSSNIAFDFSNKDVSSMQKSSTCSPYDRSLKNEPIETQAKNNLFQLENEFTNEMCPQSQLEISSNIGTAKEIDELAPLDSLEELYHSETEEDNSAAGSEGSLTEKQNLCYEDEYLSPAEKAKHWESIINLLSEEVEGEEETEKEEETVEGAIKAVEDEEPIKDEEETVEDEVVNFPIAYKRPAIDDKTNYSKQKERRNKKKSRKNVALENFLQDDTYDSRINVPEVDEFYESVIRRQTCAPYVQLHSAAEFPTLEKRDTLTFIGNQNTVSGQSDNQTELLQKSFPKLLPTSGHNSEKLDELNEVTTEPCVQNKTSTINVENIPREVTKEEIESIILGYGEIKRFSLKPSGKFQTAELELDCICDVDWIVECLNNSQPFGAWTDAALKCYKL